MKPALPRTRAKVTYTARVAAARLAPVQIKTHSPAPRNRIQAQTRPDSVHWQAAWNNELDHLESIGAISYVPRSSVPAGTKLLPTKQFMTLKTDADGAPSRYKPRCVVRGDLQRPHVHFDPDYVSVATAERDSIRLLCSIASSELPSMADLDHVDIHAAFPHERADPHQLMFIIQPLRFDGTQKYPGLVGRLDGNVYGTKQGSRVFGDGLADHLVSHGFRRAQSDRCIFTTTFNDQPLILLIVTDDFLIFGTPEGVRHAKSTINKKYRTTDSGAATKFNGWKIERSASRLKLSQPELAQAVVDSANMTNCNSAPTPYYNKTDLSKRFEHEEALDLKVYPYRHILGMLRHLADCTRPDLAFIVGVLAESQADPALRHWQAIKRVLRYVKGTIHHGISYSNQKNDDGTKQSHIEVYTATKPCPKKNQLTAYADADFAECRDTRRSRTGFVHFLNGGPVAWCARKQKSVVLSTMEAEYIALSQCTHHTISLRTRLQELNVQQGRTLMFCDNQPAERIATGAVTTPKRKYIDVHAHNVAERHATKDIKVTHIPSRDQLADFFTKLLPQPEFLRQSTRIMTS